MAILRSGEHEEGGKEIGNKEGIGNESIDVGPPSTDSRTNRLDDDDTLNFPDCGMRIGTRWN